MSLSHTRGFVAAVAATAECGIDVERIAGSIPRAAVTAREQARFPDTATDPLWISPGLWVRKEALVKVGVADEPGLVDVVGESGPADRVGRFAPHRLDGISRPVRPSDGARLPRAGRLAAPSPRRPPARSPSLVIPAPGSPRRSQLLFRDPGSSPG